MQHLIVTIFIGVYIKGLTLESARKSNYEQDFPPLISAFRQETQTPQATVIRQDNTSGVLTLLLPGQHELTPSQYCWPSFHREITGYECRFTEAADLPEHQRERNRS